ncbi:MAG TPA: 4a-hydroxytetrahydrobiopterin dehydratase [Solirubrobacteraceae bacterium]|nr:4a-hydroxytetrahydrobiopterin dehydratase [Solirubrobacteraceae bacterium]
MTVLSENDVDTRLANSAWQRESNAIAREWKLADFAAAIAFVNRVADLAEQANHHPDIDLHGWNKVSLRLSTHSEGGITQADLDMAGRIDALA